MNSSNSPAALTEFPHSHSRGWAFTATNLHPGQRAPRGSPPSPGETAAQSRPGVRATVREQEALLGLCPRRSSEMHTVHTELHTANLSSTSSNESHFLTVGSVNDSQDATPPQRHQYV